MYVCMYVCYMYVCMRSHKQEKKTHLHAHPSNFIVPDSMECFPEIRSHTLEHKEITDHILWSTLIFIMTVFFFLDKKNSSSNSGAKTHRFSLCSQRAVSIKFFFMIKKDNHYENESTKRSQITNFGDNGITEHACPRRTSKQTHIHKQNCS
jgi:hypothetical protein